MKNLKNDSSNFIELLFENRNKEYGAYCIRKEYSSNLVNSFLIAISSIVLLVGSIVLMNKNSAQETIPQLARYIEQVEIEIDLSNLQAQNKVEKIEKAKVEAQSSTTNKQDVVPEIKNNAVLFTDKLEKVEAFISPIKSSNLKIETNVLPTTGNGKLLVQPVLASSEQVKELAQLDIAPEFPGGIDKLMEFLSDNVKYPIEAKANGITGTVYVSFMVDKFGKVKEAKIKRGLFGDCDAEVLRVVHLFPDWKPGVLKGENVNVYFNLPVRFDLRN
jgi:protein TonB